MPSIGRPALTVLDGLGVPIGVRSDIAGALINSFPTSDETAVARIDHEDDVDAISAFTAAAVEHTELLGFHACVVSSPGGAVVVPGRSGLGKSTLAAALTMAGFGYLSDEVCAADRMKGRYRSFPRPITLDAGSLSVLALEPAAFEFGRTAEVAVDPLAIGRRGPAEGDLATLVIAERDVAGNVGVAIGAGQPADAAAALIESCFNHFRWPQSALAMISHIARSVTVVRARYGDATDLARELAERFGVEV